MDDLCLVEKAASGNDKAAKKLYQKYSPRLLNFILLKVEDRKDGEDILQEAFFSAFDSLPLFSGRSSFFTWLCAIAKHEIADFYRKRKIKKVLFSRLPFLEKLASRAFGPEEALAEKEMKKKTREVFGRLSEGYSRILRLKYQKGYRVGEISRELGISYKAAESRLARARAAFRKIWIRENGQWEKSLAKENFFQPSSQGYCPDFG